MEEFIPNVQDFKTQLRRHEGIRLKPYYCPDGKLTIGVGRNLDDVGINAQEADVLLDNDIEDLGRRMLGHPDLPPMDEIGPARYYALMNMGFQMGFTGLLNFQNMLKALREQDWERAKKEALDSQWARQTPSRAEEIAEILATGTWT